MVLHIDVWIDFICPWCLIGKRHLGQALADWSRRHPDVRVAVEWHSVQLIPDVPAQGWPFAAFYEHRLGSSEAVAVRQAQVRAAAARAGAVVDFPAIATFPNTAAAHRLLALAKQHLPAAAVDALVDRLFAAYFSQGEDLGDGATLAAIAAEAGLAGQATPEQLFQGLVLPDPPAVTGVPFYVFNQRVALSGAQAPEVLEAAMAQSLDQAPAR